MYTRNNTKGFTLIELLIVIILLGILVLLGLTAYTSTLKKSRDSKRKNDLRQISISLETYFNDKGHYPPVDPAGSGQFMGCPDELTACRWGSPFMDANSTLYMQQLPADPINPQRYWYVTNAQGTYYQLYAAIENTQDSDVPKNGQNEMRVFTDVNCGTITTTVYCNYGVASGNTQVTTNRTISYE